MGKLKKSLGHYLVRSLKQYFKDMENEQVSNLHAEVIEEVERNLFQFVLKHTDGNLTQAAAILGITRTTLKKKLIRYKIA